MEKNLDCIYKEGIFWRVKKTYRGVNISFRRKIKEEAKFELKRRLKEIDDKIKLDICLDKKVQKKTLKDVFEEYSKEKGSRWKYNTRNFNCRLFQNHFTSFLNIPIGNITDAIISDWIKSIKKINQFKDGRELSNLPYRVASLLKCLLKLAIRKKYCSPMLDLSFVNDIPKIKTVSEKTEKNYVNYPDFQLLCNALEKLPQSMKAQKNENMLFLIKFLYYTGLRIGEARAVKKGDIVKELIKTANGTKYIYYVNIYKQFGDNNYILDNTLKCNNPKRKVRLVSEVYQDFMNYLNSHNFEDKDYIFDFKKTNKPLYRSVISDNLDRIIKYSKKLKLLPETFVDNLSPQGFRYSNTIYLKKILKVPLEIAAENQGHTVTVMLNIYTRIDREEEYDIFSTCF